MHVDDFIEDPTSDKYAVSWFESFRRPEWAKLEKPDERKLYATYKGERYLVTGCSRMGDVWLHSDLTYTGMSYERRVNVADCSAWSSEPQEKGDAENSNLMGASADAGDSALRMRSPSEQSLPGPTGEAVRALQVQEDERAHHAAEAPALGHEQVIIGAISGEGYVQSWGVSADHDAGEARQNQIIVETPRSSDVTTEHAEALIACAAPVAPVATFITADENRPNEAPPAEKCGTWLDDGTWECKCRHASVNDAAVFRCGFCQLFRPAPRPQEAPTPKIDTAAWLESIAGLAEKFLEDTTDFAVRGLLDRALTLRHHKPSPDSPTLKAATLECDHCGDVAIESSSGYFWDGDGGRCLACGHPGHVSCDGEESPWWSTGDGEDDFCARPDCEECNERRVKRTDKALLDNINEQRALVGNPPLSRDELRNATRCCRAFYGHEAGCPSAKGTKGSLLLASGICLTVEEVDEVLAARRVDYPLPAREIAEMLRYLCGALEHDLPSEGMGDDDAERQSLSYLYDNIRQAQAMATRLDPRTDSVTTPEKK